MASEHMMKFWRAPNNDRQNRGVRSARHGMRRPAPSPPNQDDCAAEVRMDRQQFRDVVVYSDLLVLALLCLIGNAVALIAVLVIILMG